MAARHDYRRERNRPVRNALLKWQVQQDQRRLAEVQQRLMRMAAPSPSSSLGPDSYEYSDRRPPVRRTRPLPHHDPEEDALMHLIMEREQREAASSNQHSERPPIGLKPSRIPYPSALPPLRRPEEQPKPPLNASVKHVTLRPTGQKLNAAGDFYSL
ncbi:Phosphatidylinositol-4-phosphate-5-kinase (Pi-PIPK-D2) [Phytophthora cinnamomi]|uniref:Phosphatidylinositol-4-phosphate-5-kinase (Pi-PIPK-D2) n=1 Tax=Phytophthora cinnamomi TaxID=4785 RepID=UPI0035594C3A|nr:Phosphatidylinositol-4-phosphate-5-kinase (Pi-PIPK-D2) [Phytophthora cinnamomi]